MDMDKKTVFIKTSKGENEVKSKGGSLSGDLKRALFLVDDKSTFDEVSKRAAPSLREILPDVFNQLAVGGYIRDKEKPFAEPPITAPKIITPALNGELDFTGLLGSATQKKVSEDIGKQNVIFEADKTNKDAEAARVRAEFESAVEAAKMKARIEAETKADADAKLAAEIAAKNKIEADARAKQDALLREQAEARANQEAEARVRAEQAVAKAKADAEALVREQIAIAARAKQEAEIRAKQEAEVARVKAEQEAARIKAELEAAAKAKAEADEARLKAEQETARIRAELEATKAEADAQALVAERLKQEAEATRLKAEQEAARIQTELEAAKAKAAAEITEINVAKPASVGQTIESTVPKSIAPKSITLDKPDMSGQEALALKTHEEQKLAEEQAKVWADAEQRAKEQAKIEATRSTQPADATPARAAPQRNTRIRRQPFPLGKVLAGLLVLALLAIVFIPYVMPLNNYVAPIEQKLSAQFKQPVHLGNLRAATLPWPQLQLEKVTVGAGQELKVGNAVVTFDLLSLLSKVKIIRGVELRDITLDGALLDQELAWLQQVGADANYPVSHVTVQQAKISSAEVSLPVFNGEIDIDEGGKVGKVTLKSEDAKFDVGLQPAQGRWQITLNAKEISFPMFSNVLFNELSAKGEIGATGVNFAGIDGQAYGGFLHGNARLNWQQGWQLQGRIEARSVELGKLFPRFGVTGELVGASNFAASGIKLGRLADTQMEGSFIVKKGVINGIDMVETTRQGGRQHIPGGRTHFDELTGRFQANEHGRHFQQLKITSGILNAYGSFDVNTAAQISGRFSVELKARGGGLSLALTGTLTEPVLRSAQ